MSDNPTWQKAKGCKVFRKGDRMRVRLSGRKTSVVVTFTKHVVTPAGNEYLEVVDLRTGNWRCVHPDAFVGSAK